MQNWVTIWPLQTILPSQWIWMVSTVKTAVPHLFFLCNCKLFFFFFFKSLIVDYSGSTSGGKTHPLIFISPQRKYCRPILDWGRDKQGPFIVFAQFQKYFVASIKFVYGIIRLRRTHGADLKWMSPTWFPFPQSAPLASLHLFDIWAHLVPFSSSTSSPFLLSLHLPSFIVISNTLVLLLSALALTWDLHWERVQQGGEVESPLFSGLCLCWWWWWRKRTIKPLRMHEIINSKMIALNSCTHATNLF